MPRQPVHTPLLVVFALSGAAALTYESVWSAYLGLLLGHAAWAQTLVLAIFMGGMACGAWWMGRRTERIARPLVAYAAVEAAIGLAGLVFHPLFTTALELVHERVMPTLGGSAAGPAIRWAVAAALILPQSVLLGATFPLMSASLVRREPDRRGHALAVVYFSNSLGAAVGVLASGFWLVPRLGLPGAMTVAGLTNLGLALAARVAADRDLREPATASRPAGALEARGPVAGFLVAAFVTGMASFFYEIGWIRLLSLVLGTTTQSFELMLSAFILGLAIGGFLIRRLLDASEDPRRLAGLIQVSMGACALATLPLYAVSFDLMAWMLATLERSQSGWVLFQLGSHALAAAIMLPATILAGMTLPLFTYALLARGHGERTIGRVYAANTAGSILGVLVAVHVLMPAIGARGLVAAGALADATLGLALLTSCAGGIRSREFRLAAVGFAALALVTTAGVRLDPLRLASGVYRHGQSSLPPSFDIPFHEDGKTATVAIVREPSGTLRITTNGKTDAQIGPLAAPAPDEVTQVLLGALPLALHEAPRRVAVIGLGSGMTTAVLLGAEELATVETIEIEREMVEAAREVGPRTDRVWSDERSHIHVEDAKSFFSRRNERWDVIVSEPSNPWVSGVAGLFSEEFYAHVARHLAADGLLVQWIQLYETDLELVASVLLALGRTFDDYTVFHTDNSNLVVVARLEGTIGAAGPLPFRSEPIRAELARVGIRGVADLELRRLGSRALLEPLFAGLGVPPNSDYFPILAHRAPRARFLGSNAVDLTRLHLAPVPLLEMLGAVRRRELGPTVAVASFTPSDVRARAAVLVTNAAPLGGAERCAPGSGAASPLDEAALLDEMMTLAVAAAPHASRSQLDELWLALAEHPCRERLSAWTREWLALHAAVARRDGRAMAEGAATILDSRPERLGPSEVEYLVAAGLTGALAIDDRADARRFATRLAVLYPPSAPLPVYLRLLVSHAAKDVARH